MTRTPFGVPCGTLMLRNVRGGSGFSSSAAASVAAAAAAGREVPLASRELQRHGDRLIAEQRAFERARHRARIRHVVADIEAVVDAGDDEIGRAVQHLVDGDVDAVGRRAVDGVDAIADVLEAERPAQRQRVSDGAGLGLRRDDRHLAERRAARRPAPRCPGEK